MMRDADMEAQVRLYLGALPNLVEKPMFGGLAWMWNGHLLCAAREDGLLVRLGKGQDGWALELPGIDPMVMPGRRMAGWVRAGAEQGALRRKLLDAAIAFVRTLAPK
jgi:hypothetical protein